MPEGGEYLMVVDLMLEGSRVWDKGKIENTLWPVDQELIRGIPLDNGDGGDKWVWHLILKIFIRCKDKMESTSHAILDCPTSQAVWKFSRFWKVIENRRDFPFANFLRIVKSEIPMEDFTLVCWLAWKLWCERNKVVHGEEDRDPQAILDLGIASFGEWQALNQVPIQLQAVGSDVWLPPHPGFLKLNVDASVSPGSDHIGIDVVIRDEKGISLGAVAKSVEGTFSPFLAECIALREGLMIAKELESVTLVVETDAINVFRLFRKIRSFLWKVRFWRMLNS
ncbi:hypothetical protein TIFTF001_000990 [Ficus carica]|uniref:RNase H type-1 domain-containing protein n=1 Tax=Ficus carica TaxID=3494 RepID=A0AA87YY05_FICCA|nr:hypothetical protein TIFTF001_000990 [Ficus carica]